MDKKTILVLDSGAMKGVFGAGFVTGLQDENFYDNISAVYGISAGVFNGAYFLAKDSLKGSSIYWEELSKGFVEPNKLIPALVQRLTRIPRSGQLNVVDMDYLMEVATKPSSEKRLNLEAIAKSEIPFYAQVLDVRRAENVWVNFNESPVETLYAAICLAPYYSRSRVIDGREYLDAGIIGRNILKPIIDANPDSDIVWVLNSIPKNGFFPKLINLLNGAVTQRMYPTARLFGILNSKIDSKRGEIRKARDNPKVTLIYPEENSSSIETNPTILRETHQKGIDAALKFVRSYGSTA